MTDHHSLGVVRDIWRELLEGRLEIVGTPDAAGYSLLLQRAAAPVASPNRARRQELFELALRGTPQKVLSADSALAPSTIASMLTSALADLGLKSRFSRVPIALPLLAHAALGAGVLALCEVGEPESHDCPLLITLSPATGALAAALTASERDVTSRYLAGQSHQQIARARRSSPRTIANQLYASFKELRASGRFDMIRALLERGVTAGTPLKVTVRAVRDERLAKPASPPALSQISEPAPRTAPAMTRALS